MGIYKQGRPLKYNPSTKDGQEPPRKAGEYRLRNPSNNKIEYVGETNNLDRRMKEHIRTGKCKTGNDGHTFEYQVADGRSTSKTRRVHEQQKIKPHNPSLNKSSGGEGRKAKH